MEPTVTKGKGFFRSVYVVDFGDEDPDDFGIIRYDELYGEYEASYPAMSDDPSKFLGPFPTKNSAVSAIKRAREAMLQPKQAA